ncbi:MAG: hypothetical protein PHF86_07725 [Candidatus Nanoarchaeia archaeon]|nr:hypothetical protein [Candidatus Nanoarchaeia archaeon]
MSFQQQLMRKIWKPSVKQEIEIYMVVKGKILSAVRLNDINKVVEYGREVKLSEYEVNRSKDLQNAISRCWVDIIYDRGMLKRAIVVQNQENLENIKSNDKEILLKATEIARSMSEEMIKNSSLVKEIAKELAKEMISEIKNTIKVQQVSETSMLTSKNRNIEIDDTNSDNIFVDFNDDESKVTASNVSNIGVVKEERSDLSNALDALEKITRMRKQK